LLPILQAGSAAQLAIRNIINPDRGARVSSWLVPFGSNSGRRDPAIYGSRSAIRLLRSTISASPQIRQASKQGLGRMRPHRLAKTDIPFAGFQRGRCRRQMTPGASM
jgi:hypothetical protein